MMTMKAQRKRKNRMEKKKMIIMKKILDRLKNLREKVRIDLKVKKRIQKVREMIIKRKMRTKLRRKINLRMMNKKKNKKKGRLRWSRVSISVKMTQKAQDVNFISFFIF